MCFLFWHVFLKFVTCCGRDLRFKCGAAMCVVSLLCSARIGFVTAVKKELNTRVCVCVCVCVRVCVLIPEVTEV